MEAFSYSRTTSSAFSRRSSSSSKSSEGSSLISQPALPRSEERQDWVQHHLRHLHYFACCVPAPVVASKPPVARPPRRQGSSTGYVRGDRHLLASRAYHRDRADVRHRPYQ